MPTLRAARIAFTVSLATTLFATAPRAQTAPAKGATANAARPGAPTMAVEDTMHTEVPPVLVNAPRVTLDEILDRVARGEARRDSLLKDVVFTATVRLVTRTAETGKTPMLLFEDVARVYKKKPNHVRSVLLRHYRVKQKKQDDDESVHFSAETDEDIVNFAFKPEGRRDYRFRIVGRDLLGNHLIYRIAFEPRSLIGDPEPSGIVWVDTRDFVIVRQELNFDRSPVPLLLKGVDRMVVERERVGEHWMLKRVIMRARTTIPIPRLGRSFDMALSFGDYVVNQGIDDAMFPAVKK